MSRVMDDVHRVAWDAMQSKRLHPSIHADVGRHSYGSPRFQRYPSGSKVNIGSFVSIADGVTFIQGGEHFTQVPCMSPICLLIPDLPFTPWEYEKGPITIGDGVWIGYGATILSGVTVGRGAIIGAGSVVAKDVQPYEVVAGNRAQHIRYRFNPADIAEIEASRWWEASDHEHSEAFRRYTGGTYE